MKSEFEWIERFKKIIPRKMQGLIPIGDDTALLRGASGSKWLFTTDVMVDGVDFIRGQIPPEMAGRKAVAVNLSDIAAMGGKPVAFVAALGIPEGISEGWLEKFYRGMTATAQKYRTLFVGGDISRSKEFFCSVAMLGQAPASGALTRSGARPGDWIGVTGALGGSILKHHYAFEPRILEGSFLAEHVRPSAMMDISDGLVQDLGHILKASNAGAEIDIRSIPPSRDAVKLGKGRCWETLWHSLGDGEDFELLFTMKDSDKRKLEKIWPKKFPKTRLSWMGKIRKKKGIQWLDNEKPIQLKLKKKGFQHF